MNHKVHSSWQTHSPSLRLSSLKGRWQIQSARKQGFVARPVVAKKFIFEHAHSIHFCALGTRSLRSGSLRSQLFYIYFITGRPDFTCNDAISSTSVDIFAPMSTLMQVFNCTETENANPNNYVYRFRSARLLYNLTFEDREVTLSQLREVSTTVVADWFREGMNYLNISVCISNNASTPSCISSIPRSLHLQNVEITVAHNTLKLFPYGGLTRDSSFHGVTHGVVEYSPPEDIPFFSGYYRSIHVRIVYRQDFLCKIMRIELVAVTSSCTP